jgi:hypothetical protein
MSGYAKLFRVYVNRLLLGECLRISLNNFVSILLIALICKSRESDQVPVLTEPARAKEQFKYHYFTAQSNNTSF